MSVPVIYTSLPKGVVAIPRDKLVQNSVLNAALKTHENLTPEDRAFAISQILLLNLNDPQLARFILQVYKLSNTGRFSLTFNMDLDGHIKARVDQRLPILISTADTEKAWPELYDNPYLSPTERETINQMSNREYYAFLNAIQTASCAKDFENILPCVAEQAEELSVNTEGIYYNSLYSKCYDTVCLYEAEQKGKIINLDGQIPQVAHVADKTSADYGKYCFPLMELIKQLSEGNYINPQSKQRFSDRTLSQLLAKYKKEVAMYRKHLEILQSVGNR